MATINHTFEPSRLFLVWHHLRDDSPRHRRIVGEIYKDGSHFYFRYTKATEDFKLAKEEGFIGFPAFTMNSSEPFKDVLDVFTKRLPPRKRADFGKYLSQYGLPENFSGSEISLLGYTGARLESDSFELCPDYSEISVPADLILDISGANYHVTSENLPKEETPVQFERDPENIYDSNAIAIYCNSQLIGYLNKALTKGFRHLLETMKISGKVLKSQIKQNKIQILVHVKCRTK